MSDLRSKLAAGVRAAREDEHKPQDSKGGAGGETAAQKDTSQEPASPASRPAASTKVAAGKKGATGGTKAAKDTSQKPASKTSRPAASTKVAAGKKAATPKAAGRKAAQADAGSSKATADEPWKNLHPTRIWPD